MPIDRNTIIAGAGKITYAGQNFYSKGEISEVQIVNNIAIPSSAWGTVDKREINKKFEIAFEPDGRMTLGLAAVLYPYAALSMGQSLIGASDRALVIHGRDGKKRTYHNAVLTKLPDFNASTGRTIQGSLTFTALCKNNTAPSAANAFYTDAVEAYPGDAGWLVSDIKTEAFTSNWGASAPWAPFATKNGWVVSFGLTTTERTTDSDGIIDIIMSNLEVTARAIPLVSREAVSLKMRPQGAQGASIAAGADALEISNATVALIINNAAITNTKISHDAVLERVGETTWEPTRTVTSGAGDPLFRIEMD